MTLDIGIIGCGVIADYHLRALAEQPECRVTACADVNSDSAQRCAAAFHVPRILADGHALLQLQDLDLVVICTPPKWHAELLLQALQLRKHVLVEKPLAMDLQQAQSLVTAAAKTDRIVGVALMHRYLPVYRAVHDFIQAGVLGTVRRVRLSLGRSMIGDSRFTTPQSDPRSWLVNRTIAGGGMLMSSSIHFFSVVSYLLGNRAALTVAGRVRQLHPIAFPGIEDDIDLVVRWDNNIEFTYRESWVADLPYRGQIDGDEGQLVLSAEGFTNLSLETHCRNSLPHPYETLDWTRPVSNEQLQALIPQPSLFSGLWADLVKSIRQKSRVPRLPGLEHARNMQSIVTAACRTEVTRQLECVDWFPEKTVT